MPVTSVASLNKLWIRLSVLGVFGVSVVAAEVVSLSSGEVVFSEDSDVVAVLFISRLLVVSDTSRCRTLANSSVAGSCLLPDPEPLRDIGLSAEDLIWGAADIFNIRLRSHRIVITLPV